MKKKELSKLAQEIHRNEIFTDRHLRDQGVALMVFMPLLFLNDEQREAMGTDIGMIYAYHRDVIGGRAVNGYPMFGKIGYLNKAEAAQVWKMYAKIKRNADIATLPFFQGLLATIFPWIKVEISTETA